MIWASTSDGAVTYVGPEWTLFTGQTAAAALGTGWHDMVHPDDLADAGNFCAQACASASVFTVQFRLRHVERGYVPVIGGASPSISPVDGSFIGYLGTITELGSNPSFGNVIGTLKIPPTTVDTAPMTPIDVIADYLLLAKKTAMEAGEARMLASLDFAISEIMRRLGYRIDESKVH